VEKKRDRGLEITGLYLDWDYVKMVMHESGPPSRNIKMLLAQSHNCD
jgi:hypothetical protein